MYQAHNAQFVEWMNEKININEGIEVNQQRKVQSDGGEGGGGVVDLEKKSIMWELRVKFYLGQYEDCSLGDSTSDGSEKLLQRRRGKNSIYVILVKGKYMWSGTLIFLESFCWSCEASASHEKQSSQWGT